MKRGLNIHINFTNRAIYTFVAFIVLLIIGVTVFALTPGVAPNPGHLIDNVAPPSPCSAGQVLQWDGINWVCAVGGGSAPSGAVMAFNLASCPSGWSEYTEVRGRTIIGTGQGTGLTNRLLSETGGEETHTLTISEMPAHNHPNSYVRGGSGEQTRRTGYVANAQNSGLFDKKPVIMTSQGGNQPHNIIQPFVALLYCVKD